jgi:cyclic pyranopterin phosphate synthase
MLIDCFARIHDYLRIAVTDRCNFRCTYCMPEDGIELGPKTELLTFEEIECSAKLLVRLGVRKIRITGGEPLVRHGIERLFEMLSGIDALEVLALSTNGALLEEKLPMLWKHRIHQLNISLDTLRPDRFLSITGCDACETVQRAIRAAVAYRSRMTDHPGASSFQSVKVNMVVMRGINDDEVLDFVRFGDELSKLAHGGPKIEIRFIEFMPFPGNAWNEERSIPWRELLPRIEREYTLKEAITADVHQSGTAKSFEVVRSNTDDPGSPLNRRGSAFRIGFIPTVSEPFCGDCSRLRLTADGTFRTCLFGEDGLNLRDMFRRGESFETMTAAINATLQEKWLEHPPVHELAYLNSREMISIGG